MKGEHRQSEETGWVGGEETLVWDNVVGGQNPPRKGCSRAILRARENKGRKVKEMMQEDRGGSGAPVAPYSAEKAPQAVEKPGLAC